MLTGSLCSLTPDYQVLVGYHNQWSNKDLARSMTAIPPHDYRVPPITVASARALRRAFGRFKDRPVVAVRILFDYELNIPESELARLEAM